MKKKMWISSIIIFLSIGFCTMQNYNQSDDTLSFINNPKLQTILSENQWQGTGIDKDGKFSNLEHPFNPTFSMAWQMMTEGNPQREIKNQDTFNLPVVNDSSFLENSENVIVWLGHATFFIRLNGISIITDPVFNNASLTKRKSPLPFDVNLLKDIDYILISHDHRDHLDKKSLQLIVRNNPQAEILSGLKMDEWFNKMLDSPKMQLAGWYQQYNTDTSKIKIYFLPARHWSSRNLFDTNKHLWGSFVIQTDDKKIYFSGDTGYNSHLKEVGTLFNGIDICIMGIGAFKPEWFMSPNHISPYDAVKASNEMQAKQFIPMHYGTFDLSNEPLGEPIEIMQNEKQQDKLNAELINLKVGENFHFK